VIKETSDQLDLLVVQVELVEWVRVRPGQQVQPVEPVLKVIKETSDLQDQPVELVELVVQEEQVVLVHKEIKAFRD
jgi:hypothetical protein